jgi:hypothetical protein
MARKNSKNASEKLETKDENLLSTAEIAAEAGVSSQYIARLERAGVIEKSGYGRYARSEVAKIHAFRAGEPLPGEESPAGLTHERTLLVRAQREKAELDHWPSAAVSSNRALRTRRKRLHWSRTPASASWRFRIVSRVGSGCRERLSRVSPKIFGTPWSSFQRWVSREV